VSDKRNALTPEALAMVDTIERTGSFAAAARELGKVPSALTYSVRQLEEALDVLLFDRRSRQAQLTAAGEELLREGRHLLQQIDAVANRVRRVATGWETQLTIAVDSIVAPSAVFELVEAFYTLRVAPPPPARPANAGPRARQEHPARTEKAGSIGAPPTRLKLLSETLNGTTEALLSGVADLAIGVGENTQGSDLQCEQLGQVDMLLAVAPHHPLAKEPEPVSAQALVQHRIVAIADTARRLQAQTWGVLPGQDVLTVPSLVAKLEAQLRGLGCGRLPEPLLRRHVEAGRLVIKQVEGPPPRAPMYYAWRKSAAHGNALQWWLQRLASPATRRALLEQYAGLIL
jgi:DNA-binding transcriptional LysR family regulator